MDEWPKRYRGAMQGHVMEEFQEWESIEGTDDDTLRAGSGPSFIRQERELCNDNRCLNEARAESILAGLVNLEIHH